MEHNSTHLPSIEATVLEFWRREDIFAKTVALRREGKPFVFYDGPPFTTGLPHYGHILQMAIKDAVLRYKTMQGFDVPRKIGWDTHGLPVEYELEKELGLTGGKRAIEEYGIERFVEAARGIVLRCTAQWKETMERMGRWVDVSNPYTTMDNNYIESVWWAFAELYKKGLVYKDFRVSPYCPRCGTVISNFEVNQGYKDNVADPSVYVAVPVTSKGEFEGANLVLWTTTPWTLPSNVALAVNTEETYVVVRFGGKRFIVAKALADSVFAFTPDGYDALEKEVQGGDLVGLTYEPIYRTVENHTYRVVPGHHVSMNDGSGIVHMAPAFGEDDFVIGRKESLPMPVLVEPDGTVKKGHGLPGEGLFVKEADDHIIEDLSSRGLMLQTKTIRHTYPFCWRCDTPLLYFPATSWYVKVTDIKERIVAENSEINWQPAHLRDGRFGKWLEGVRDWAISRDRYWGAPLPVWECEKCESVKVVGSRSELPESLDDLHRPYIDDVSFTCSCGGEMHRVPFVFDCWFESGSMPYAQHHYPFENKANFVPAEHKGYPADFIGEALDQTRGWFYSLHVLGVALFNKKAFKNVVVSGLLLAADGKKLSKRLRNYTAPEVVMDEQGVDALRLFLFTGATIGEDYRFSDTALNDVKRRWLVPLLNVLQYYRLSLRERDESVRAEPEHALLDAWMRARVAEVHEQIVHFMEGDNRHSPFDLARACRTFGPLVEDLSTWYVRLSRGRKDPQFTDTLRAVLQQLATSFAPFMPFVMEHVYQTVKMDGPLSVHMLDFSIDTTWRSPEVLAQMALVRDMVAVGRELRASQGIPLRQPLAVLELDIAARKLPEAMLQIIAQELNVQSVLVVERMFTEGYLEGQKSDFAMALNPEITPELAAFGTANALRRLIQDLRKQAKLQPGDVAQVLVTDMGEAVHSALEAQLAGYTELVTAVPSAPELASSTYEQDGITYTVTLYAHVTDASQK